LYWLVLEGGCGSDFELDTDFSAAASVLIVSNGLDPESELNEVSTPELDDDDVLSIAGLKAIEAGEAMNLPDTAAARSRRGVDIGGCCGGLGRLMIIVLNFSRRQAQE
jgi:hypothetical protein